MDKLERMVEEKWGLGPGPVVLTGSPVSCQGYVELINKSAEDVEPKAIAITGLHLKPEQTQAPAVTIVTARIGPHDRFRLGPYDRFRVPIVVTLDPTTPPGSYTGQLCCGSQREDVVIHVVENWDLRILPQRVTITASPGEKFAFRILITNLGNIEFTLQNLVLTHLGIEQEIGQYLNAALNAALQEAGKQGFEKFLDRFVRELAESAVNPATVKLKSEEPKIRAGETKEVELEIQFPDEMRKNRVYAGKMRFKNAYLRIEVECNGTPQISPRRQK